MQQARNDEKFWYEKVLPLQRKLRSKLKSLDESPKPLQSRTYYVHTDHLGTPRELTNNSGDIVWSASYKAWGATASIEHPPTQQTVQVGNTAQVQWVQPLADEAPEQNLRFQGQYFDAETGLHYNRFRYYDPDCGRFVSQDPIGLFGGNNFYQYAPNPLDWIDPLGLARFGSGKGTHTAQVTVHKANGTSTPCGVFQSGNMTPEEKALGFPKNSLATHTEARAATQVPLEPGDHMIIDGQYPPCPSCKGKMNARAGQTGATIQYNWTENGQQKTWVANPPKGCK